MHGSPSGLLPWGGAWERDGTSVPSAETHRLYKGLVPTHELPECLVEVEGIL
jgi:hypothetical protein